MPIPTPEPPVLQLKRHYTSPELKKELSASNLSTSGTKSDLCLRLVKHKSGMLTKDEIANEFTVAQLQKRLKAQNVPIENTDKKSDLVSKYAHHFV